MQDDAAAREPRDRWGEWYADFWNAITSALGEGNSPNVYCRRFDDVYVMLDFIDNDGQILLSAVGTPLPSPGTRFGVPSHRLYWDRADPFATAQTVLSLVEKIRNNPIHRMMQLPRDET